MLKNHPRGLYLLFFTEMWERFSYYGMRALLVLYMTKELFYTKGAASSHYGTITSLIYLSPVIGGYIADRYWGNRRAIIVGGIFMAMGNFILALSDFAHGTSYQVFQRQIFFFGIIVLIVGVGFFKSTISSMVGQLYPPEDKRLDSAFTLFYMGINLGAFMAPFIAGTLGEVYGFKYGFMAAGIGMVTSLCIFISFKKHLLGPNGESVGSVSAYKEYEKETKRDASKLTPVEIDRIIAIFMVSFFVIFFWTVFEQAGASLTFFADEQLNKTIFGFTVPTTWFQAANALFIITLAPLFSILWGVLANKNKEPSSVTKMFFALLFISLSYFMIAFVVKDLSPIAKTSMFWLLGLYFMHSVAELFISPIGLSVVVKLSPVRFVSSMLGVWFIANFIANKLAGYFSSYYPGPSEDTIQGVGLTVAQFFFETKNFFGYRVENLFGDHSPYAQSNTITVILIHQRLQKRKLNVFLWVPLKKSLENKKTTFSGGFSYLRDTMHQLFERTGQNQEQ